MLGWGGSISHLSSWFRFYKHSSTQVLRKLLLNTLSYFLRGMPVLPYSSKTVIFNWWTFSCEDLKGHLGSVAFHIADSHHILKFYAVDLLRHITNPFLSCQETFLFHSSHSHTSLAAWTKKIIFLDVFSLSFLCCHYFNWERILACG